MTVTNAEWLASRVHGREIEHDDYVKDKISKRYRNIGRLYPAAHNWVIFRDGPGLSKGAWLWIAERLTEGRVELRGFDKLKHAQAWCKTNEGNG